MRPALAADVQRQLVLLDGLSRSAGQALEGQHGVVSALHRPRIHVGVIGLLLAQLLDPLGNVIVRDLGILVRDGNFLVALELDGGATSNSALNTKGSPASSSPR